MGKTADGAVWLNADPSLGKDHFKSPYDYWQFWRNTDDADVGKFMRLFTDMDLGEIAQMEALEGADINTAKVRLANEATAMLHGQDAAIAAEQTARTTFEQGGTAAGLPTFETDAGTLAELSVLDAAILVGLAASKGEGRRHIKGNALKINDARVESDTRTLGADDIDSSGVIKISVGKKRHALIKPV